MYMPIYLFDKHWEHNYINMDRMNNFIVWLKRRTICTYCLTTQTIYFCGWNIPHLKNFGFFKPIKVIFAYIGNGAQPTFCTSHCFADTYYLYLSFLSNARFSKHFYIFVNVFYALSAWSSSSLIQVYMLFLLPILLQNYIQLYWQILIKISSFWLINNTLLRKFNTVS